LALYLEEHTLWLRRVGEDYGAGLSELRQISRQTPGIVGAIAAEAGVSRRRLWTLRDPTRQARVADAIRQTLTSSPAR
jgi:hypothetical protein